ncbi:MAG: hypothetical protein RL701_5025 [Pseudomonadota bacterium]
MTQNEQKTVDLARFAQLLDAYGADTERWPEAERASAMQLLTVDEQARTLQRQALEFDALLDAAPAFEAAPSLRARVLEIPIRHERNAERKRGFFGLRSMTLFALVPCVIGFLSGALYTEPQNADDEDDAWSEIATLTLPGDLLDEDEEL